MRYSRIDFTSVVVCRVYGKMNHMYVKVAYRLRLFFCAKKMPGVCA